MLALDKYFSGVWLNKSYRYYWTARFLTSLCPQIIAVAIGWHIYDITRDPLYLGLVGLSQFLPQILLVIITGYVSDKFNRKIISFTCLILESILAFSFLLILLIDQSNYLLFFIPLVGLGIVRAFIYPAEISLIANIVEEKDLPQAVALSTLSWQTASIFGPVMGGILYGISAFLPYIISGIGALYASILILSVTIISQNLNKSSFINLKTITSGFKYIYNNQVLFGVISLDLFAVLLAGAVALLPVYARDILDAGPIALGVLRSAPAIGAVLVGLYLALYPIKNNSGLILLIAVAFFGIVTIIFGLSKNILISIFFLVLVGAFDMLSVYIREVLIQLRTEDHMRGKVNAINGMFIGASNELGEFRAGFMASGIGAVPTVVIGGVGAIFVSGAWYFIFPKLRNIINLKEIKYK